MRPWTSIWTNTRKTIDEFRDSDWVRRQGLLVYTILGTNAVGESEIPQLIGYDSSPEGALLILSVVFISGFLMGLALRIIWVNLIFYFGKIWNGQATKRNIDTIIALCLIPEALKLISLAVGFVSAAGDLNNIKINYALTTICAFLSIRILLIGLARVQNFSYGLSILNIVVPQLTIWVLYYSIR